MTKETKKWWEKTSAHYQDKCKIPVSYLHYGPCCPTEAKLKLLGNVKGKHVLEIGCGGAQNSIYLAKRGAKVTGIDISTEQLAFAKALAKKHNVNITFHQRDIVSLKPIKSNSQDIVLNAFAIQYVHDLKKCFKEVFRVLKKKGIFVFALDHPFFRCINSKTLKIKQSYFDIGRWTDREFVMYNHTVSEIFNILVKVGFTVTYIHEGKQNLRDPDPWRDMWDYTPKLVKNIPPTIIFKAEKK